jgi:hypothetical protein
LFDDLGDEALAVAIEPAATDPNAATVSNHAELWLVSRYLASQRYTVRTQTVC